MSKRTVYDYFGDKRALLHAVLDTVGRSLVATIRRTLDDALPADIAADDLAPALETFAMRIATGMLGSAEYTTLQRLVRVESGQPDHNPLADTLDEAIAERFAAFATAGLLDIADPRLAADQFLALTFGVALNRLGSANAAADSRVRPLVLAGVRTFLRAYRTR